MDMNIKGLFGANATAQIRPTEKVDRSIRSDSSHERDANGQQTFDQGGEKRGPMSEEQLQKALEHLRQLAAVKENKWTVILEVATDEKKGEKRYVLIKDNLGTVIRRFHEEDLWSLQIDGEPGKGQLLKKTA